MNPILLIVDDEPAGRQALESVLITQDYDLVFAENGFEALKKARDLQPDVILLDIMMPDLDGYEVCRLLRADPRVAEVPVVMVTALDDRDSRLRGLEAGADDFITKPIDRGELRARVRTITRLNRYRRLQDERAKLERQLDRLTALRTIDLAITASLDLDFVLTVLLQQVTSQLSVDAAAVFLYSTATQTLEYATGRGFRFNTVKDLHLPIGQGIAGKATQERKLVAVPNVNDLAQTLSSIQILRSEEFIACFAIPLLSKGQVEGVLEIFHRSPINPSAEWLDFFEALGQQAAIAIDNARLFERLQRSNDDLMMAYDATIEGWSRALDLRDKETEGHTLRVTRMTMQLAQMEGISNDELVHIRRGALLHDIGKLGIPDSILLKPHALNEKEWEIMRRHPIYAYEMLSPIAYLRPALDIPYCHHEKWDGTGYPRGLQADHIPLAARIFAIVDVWDALRSDRPYREGWPEDKVLAYIEQEAGKHFDPRVTKKFLKMF